jgi:hypothetical protein
MSGTQLNYQLLEASDTFRSGQIVTIPDGATLGRMFTKASAGFLCQHTTL